jgi:hypothetical protein
MILDCKLSGACAARLATARLDREFVAEKADAGGWIDRAVAQFRPAICFRIPVGFQDEAGFHCGIQHQTEQITIACGRKNQMLKQSCI